jgi:hypothetical protein
VQFRSLSRKISPSVASSHLRRDRRSLTQHSCRSRDEIMLDVPESPATPRASARLGSWILRKVARR